MILFRTINFFSGSGTKAFRSFPHTVEFYIICKNNRGNEFTPLIGEQPNPWDLFQPQDGMSRHRGAKQLRR